MGYIVAIIIFCAIILFFATYIFAPLLIAFFGDFFLVLTTPSRYVGDFISSFTDNKVSYMIFHIIIALTCLFLYILLQIIIKKISTILSIVVNLIICFVMAHVAFFNVASDNVEGFRLTTIPLVNTILLYIVVIIFTLINFGIRYTFLSDFDSIKESTRGFLKKKKDDF